MIEFDIWLRDVEKGVAERPQGATTKEGLRIDKWEFPKEKWKSLKVRKVKWRVRKDPESVVQETAEFGQLIKWRRMSWSCLSKVCCPWPHDHFNTSYCLLIFPNIFIKYVISHISICEPASSLFVQNVLYGGKTYHRTFISSSYKI